MEQTGFYKLDRDFLNLPIHLCDFAIREKFFSPFHLYIYLKTKCRGQIKLPPKAIQYIGKELGVCTRTVKNNIQKLRERNWLGFDPQSGYYFVRGFEKIKQIEGLKGRKGVCLTISKDIRCVEHFKALVMGASIGYLAKVQKWKARCEQESEHFQGSSKHRSREHLPSHYPIACQALVSLFGISRRSASQYKKLAAEYSFIDLKKNQKKIGTKETGISARFAAHYKKAHPEIAHLIRIRKADGKYVLFMEQSDTVQPRMEYTKRHRPAKK